MCRATKCTGCSKTTWAGCGKHIDAALASVAMADRCAGWRTGKCTGAAVSTVTKICSTCSMALQAEDQASLDGIWGRHIVRFPACAPAAAEAI